MCVRVYPEHVEKRIASAQKHQHVIKHLERGDKPDEITLARDIFEMESEENTFVNVKAKIIYI